MKFTHEALGQAGDMPLVYTAISKHLFYFRMHISKYVLEQGKVPLNPFMIFDYFFLDTVDRNLVRSGNNSVVKKADEIWVFGDVSNGVLAEILLAKSLEKPVKYFRIEKSREIIPISVEEVAFEDDVKQFAGELKAS